jgi:transcriptional regulator GlxA family with amidase domain
MNALRGEAAKWLLLEARENIETVAARIGQHDGSHLSKLFLRYAGTRPGAYRLAARQGTSGAISGESDSRARPW